MYITERKKSSWENYPWYFYPRTTLGSGHEGFYHVLSALCTHRQTLRLSFVFSQRLFPDWPTYCSQCSQSPASVFILNAPPARVSSRRGDPDTEMRHFIAQHIWNNPQRKNPNLTQITTRSCTVTVQYCTVYCDGSFSSPGHMRDQQSNGTLRSRILYDKYSRSL